VEELQETSRRRNIGIEMSIEQKEEKDWKRERGAAVEESSSLPK
jgi:hypothetical protein